MIDTIKPLRSDAQRTAATILQAAERVLRHDPTASLGQIAAAAGVTRTTVHRRFANRQVLIAALQASAIILDGGGDVLPIEMGEGGSQLLLE